MATVLTNPYLTGPFAPVREERDDDLEVSGALPPELDGLLVRNGPNPVTAPDAAAYHWFLGDGMLHGIELSGGRARYRNRWVRTDGVCAALGETPPADQPVDVYPGPSSTANTAVVPHRGELLALVEAGLPTRVGHDLTTIGRFDFDGRLRSPMTAHPKYDPRTGEVLFFGYDVVEPPYLRYHVVGPDGSLVRSEDVTLPAPVMVHDFAVTSSRVVWFDLPVVFDLSTLGSRPFPAAWDPTHQARVGVMPRDGADADIVWIDVDPCYVFHVANAYDDADGNVVIDLARYDDMFSADPYGPGSDGGTTFERWTVDARGGSVSIEVLDDTTQEFPRVDDRLMGRPHRYAYTAEVTMGEHWVGFGALRKHDVVSGTTARHDVGAGRHAAEPVFAPATPDAGEDHGWVLSIVHDEAREASDVIVVDATDFSAPPVATVHLRSRVPYGFHGSWVAGASLG